MKKYLYAVALMAALPGGAVEALAAEYRHDKSDANVFDKDTLAQVDSQDTLGLNVIYHF